MKSDKLLCAIATCRPFFQQGRPLAPDDPLLQRALLERGVLTEFIPWEDADYDWSRADVVMIRSTWNYHLHPEAYLAWAERVASVSRLLNPLPVVRWNLDKAGYFSDLHEAGIPTIPTRRLLRGETVHLAGLLAETGWMKFVAKPCIGANSYATLVIDASSASSLAQGQQHLDRYLPERDMLLQPYLARVEAEGEHSHVFIAGRWSHVFSRVPFCERHGEIAGEELLQPGPDEMALAQLTMKTAERLLAVAPLLFGRVDLIRDEEGQWRLMELEVNEPALHLEATNALTGLADAFMALCAGGGWQFSCEMGATGQRIAGDTRAGRGMLATRRT